MNIILAGIIISLFAQAEILEFDLYKGHFKYDKYKIFPEDYLNLA